MDWTLTLTLMLHMMQIIGLIGIGVMTVYCWRHDQREDAERRKMINDHLTDADCDANG